MKRLLSILLFTLITAALVRAQGTAPALPIDEDTKLITYKEVVQQAGTKLDLFNRAVEWINKNYKNPADVTKVRNPETGLIELIHRIELSYDEKGVSRSAGIVDYTLRLELKEGRYRYTFTNFNLKQASRVPIEKWLDKSDKAYIPAWDNYLAQVDAYTKTLIESLKKGMEPPAVKKSDDW
ncbi:MAG: DUF4468 domain-containing protein [Bacteroidales bacterium]|nr:DUF4468 domain-containing protein [Bacteroidales bacterium]